MPANRRPVDRKQKRDEIVAAATQMFTELGFDETPMTQLATAAGVTTNTIYWYFADKDALLVAVLEKLLAEALTERASGQVPGPSAPLADQLLWAIERLQTLNGLVTVVHMRAATSPVVADWHDRFHALTDATLAHGFRQAGMREDDIAAATRIGVFVVEGLLTHPSDARATQAVVRLLTTDLRPATPTGPSPRRTRRSTATTSSK